MKTIQIADDIYDHLLRNVQFIREDESSILRRLLGLRPLGSRPIATSRPAPKSIMTTGPSQLDDCIQHTRFQMEREAVGKFLFILGWLSKRHGTEFRKILDIRGRRRKYFAESATELEESGSSVNPQQIPDSPYWVITNNDTPKKVRMLADIMKVLGYSDSDIELIRNNFSGA